jgi:predicted MFS family arabinose efflux permease
VDLARSAVLAVLTLAILSHHVDITLVLAVLFLMGVAEVFGNTASATLLPMLVDRSDLGVANARLQAGFVTVNQLAGPPIGAALFAAAVWLAFAGQMVLVVIGALLVAQVHVPRVHAAPAAVQRVRTDIVDGIRWVLHHAAVRTLVLTILIFNVTFGAAWSVLVLYAKQRLGMGAIGFGLLTTSSAVGGLLGTLAYGWITGRITLGDVMRIGLIIETLTHLALALTTNAYVAIAIFFVFGAHAFVWGTTSATVRQRAVPIAMQGRVSGVNALCSYGGIVVGSAIGGPVAAAWGITAPFWFAFVGSAVFVVLIWRQLAHIAHDDDEPAGALAAAT